MILTLHHLDALQELINIGVGQAAAILNDMLDSHITLQVPVLKLLAPAEICQEMEQSLYQERVSAVRVAFAGLFSGETLLVFPTESAAKLVAVLTSDESEATDLNAIKIGTLTEVGNIVINSVMGSISNLLGQSLRYTVPIYREEPVRQLLPNLDLAKQPHILLAKTHFCSNQLNISGDILLIFQVGSLDRLLTALEIA